MNASRATAIALLALVAIGSLRSERAVARNTSLLGYGPVQSERERQTELSFVDIPTAQSALDDLGLIGAQPHYAGTTGDYALAIALRDRLRAYGLTADLEPLRARVETPRRIELALSPPADLGADRPRKSNHKGSAFPIVLDLTDVPLPATTGARTVVGIPFNAGSADGDVSAPLVYAGRGLDADYATLADAEVDVRGAVVLVRYGAQFRGRLAARAQSHGAAGVIFYSDPADDASSGGAAYPAGPGRPPTAVERGWIGTGIHIPTIPISAANARMLLASLEGRPGPPNWSGGLGVGYPLARGPGRVHLVVQLERKVTTLWNTIAVIPGLRDDHSVMLGAHRDAWVYGVGDDGSGLTTLLEVGRGLGYLWQGGWRPRHSIILAAWDGEEIGFIGSQAYARAHRLDVTHHALAYISADETVTGPTFLGGASAAIAPIVLDAARLVHDPLAPAATIYDRWAARTPAGQPRPDLAGGGDHESSPAQTGTPSAVMRFTGPFGVYHTAYDTLDYARRWSDPDLRLHRASAQLYGVVTLRLADAATVPYVFSGYVGLLRGAQQQLQAAATDAGTTVDTRALRLAIADFAAIAARVDARFGPGDDPGERAVHAARELDQLLYDSAGSVRTTFADAAAALADHDGARVAAALDRATSVVADAASALTP